MADQRIDQLNAETTPAAVDLLPVFSIAGAETKKITVKNLVQVGATLIDNASIPVAKVNLSGISGANLSAGTVPITALDATNDILATGGLAVSSGNLELVAPTSPIVRNAGTGSLEHATSGVTANTYTKVTVDAKGHVTVGATLAGADVPVATSAVVGGVSIPAAGGLALTGGGALSHSNAVAGGASTRSGITYDLQGHIVSTVAIVASDLPAATTAAKGAVIAGTGLAVDVNGILSTAVATTSDLGGIKIGSEFGLNGSNQLLLAVQANVAGGSAYPKVTVNSKGVVTAGAALDATDIPDLAATKITSGSLDIARIATNTITGAKLANTSTALFGDTQPTAEYTGQLYFNSLTRDIYIWDSNVWQPIGISVGEIIFAGTFDCSLGSGTGLIASVTAEGTAIGLAIGQVLPAAAAANSRYYLVVSEAGTITSGNAPNIALTPPDILLSNGTTWAEIDVSQTITAQVASNVSVTPVGNISATNVQTAIQELDTEKLPIAGGTITGNLEIGTAGSLTFEGSTANTFETTLSVVDPTADRTIALPNISGTVITTGDTGTVTSTMLLDGTILNEDINASAAIAYSKLATLTSANIIVGSSANVATSTAVTGDISISNTGVTAIASDVIVNADINASAAIADTKLATIATAGKVSNSATTAASANTASAIVARDASGNFTAGTITAAVTGAASSNVLKAGDTMTGNLTLNAQSDLRFADSDSSHYIALQAPATVTANVTMTLPAADGTNGQVLTTNGAGTLSFTTGAGGGSQWTTTGSDIYYTTGKVGIGTATPSARLHISAGESSLSTGFLQDGATTGYNAIVIKNTSGYTLIGVNGTTVGLLASSALANSTVVGTNNSTVLHLITNGNVRATVDTAGLVGIGDTAPDSTLTIKAASSTTPLRISGPSSEFARVDSSGRLLIGTSTARGNFYNGSDTTRVQIEGSTGLNSSLALVGNANSTYFEQPRLILAKAQGSGTGQNGALSNGDVIGDISFQGSDGTEFVEGARIRANVDGTPGANDMPSSLVFSTTADGSASPTERMRVTSGGQLFINDTTDSAGAGSRLHIKSNASQSAFSIQTGSNGANGIFFANTSSAQVGGIVINSGSTAYNTTSDYRLKENVIPISDGITRLQQLKPSRFNFITDPAETVDGFIAHEVQDIAPEAITGEKDAVDDDGNPKYQGIDQSKLVPLLTAALQEAIAKIESLEARLTAAGL